MSKKTDPIKPGPKTKGGARAGVDPAKVSIDESGKLDIDDAQLAKAVGGAGLSAGKQVNEKACVNTVSCSGSKNRAECVNRSSCFR